MRMRVVARQVATVSCSRSRSATAIPLGGRRRAPAAPGSCCSTECSRSTSRWATGRPPSSWARATCSTRGTAGPTTCSATAGWHVLVPGRVAVLDAAFAERVRPWPQILLALLRRAARRAGDLDVQRAIASPAAPRGPPGAAAVAPRRALGEGRAGRHPPRPAAHPSPARPARGGRAPVGVPCAGPPFGRRARHRPRRRVAPARHARRAPRVPGRARGPHPRRARHRATASAPAPRDAADRVHPGPARSERQLVHVVWMTSGLGCDGDTVALTAATSPSLEDLLTGAIPGMPGVVIYNPMLAFETGEDLMRAWYDARARPARPLRARARGLGAQRGDQRRGPLGRLRRRPSDGPADHHLLVDRPAGPEGGRRHGDRHVRGLRRRPGHAQQPDGRHGAARLPRRGAGRRGSASRSSTSPGCPVPPDNITETLLHLVLQLGGMAPTIDLDDQGRPRWLFDRTVHETLQPRGLRRAAAVSPTRSATTALPGQARVQGPRRQVQRAGARLGQRDRRLPERRRHLHRLHERRLPRSLHALHGARPARRRWPRSGARFTYGPVLKYFRDAP